MPAIRCHLGGCCLTCCLILALINLAAVGCDAPVLLHANSRAGIAVAGGATSNGYRMKIGFCGLGLMGAPMVRRLLAAGHQVTVWNRSPAKAASLADAGASIATSPAQAAEGCAGVLLCLYDAAAVEAVVFGPAGVARASGLSWLADHSSIPPDVTRRLARQLSDASGADWIDAPVSGGVGGVEAGTLAIMAGGPLTHFEEAAGVMRAYAGQVTHMGSCGAGQATKLCNQTIVATTVVAIAEALSFARHNAAALQCRSRQAPSSCCAWRPRWASGTRNCPR